MVAKKVNSLRKLVLILMILATFFHFVQMFLAPINLKWYIALLGAIAYAFASLGIYLNKKFGYYITIIIPAIGGILIIIVLLIAFITQIEIIQFNIFTMFATIVEIPAVIISIFLIRIPPFSKSVQRSLDN